MLRGMWSAAQLILPFLPAGHGLEARATTARPHGPLVGMAVAGKDFSRLNTYAQGPVLSKSFG